MGRLIDNATGESKEIADGDSIKVAAEELGVIFGCEQGDCGTCQIEIIQGRENLMEMNDSEKMFSVDDGHRLACQCKLRSGDVKISF